MASTPRHPVAAEDGAGLPRDGDRRARVAEFGDRDLMRLQGACVLQPPQPQGEQLRLFDRHRHVDELLLGELEPGDRLVELHPVLRILQRCSVAVASGTDDSPADAVARLVEARERCAQPPRLRELRIGGQSNIREGDVALDGGAHRELRRDGSGHEPRRLRGDDEPANTLIGLRPDDGDIGDRGESDPALCAVEHPVVSVAPRERGHARRVGSGVGLGEAETADHLTARHLRQPVALLLLAAVLVDRAHRQ